jgi:hypothetical protein
MHLHLDYIYISYQEIYASVLEEKERQLRLLSQEHTVLMKLGESIPSTASGASLHPLHPLDDHKESEHWVHDRLIDWPEGKVNIFFHVVSLPIKAAL